MRCEEWERLYAGEEAVEEAEQHVRECKRCRALADEMAANLAALRSMREEILPPVTVRPSLRRWRAPAAAAAVFAILTLGGLGARRWLKPAEHPHEHAARPQTLMVKMYTADPNVVIYWLIESKPGESE